MRPLPFKRALRVKGGINRLKAFFDKAFKICFKLKALEEDYDSSSRAYLLPIKLHSVKLSFLLINPLPLFGKIGAQGHCQQGYKHRRRDIHYRMLL